LSHLSEYILFGLYLLAGPVTICFFGLILLKGRKRMMLVGPLPASFPTDPSRVTIVIPAKDEAHHIRHCLASALAQDYPDFEVLAVDDRSTDGTAQTMDQMAQPGRPLTVIHVGSDAPPVGWTGKCHALHTGVARAAGEWLLFIDSDVVLEPHALAATLACAQERKVDLFSLMPQQSCRSFWERLLIPLAGCCLSTMHLVALTNNDHLRRCAFANGQYMLFRRSVYDAIGGHEFVRDHLCEDVALARLVKAAGHRVRLCIGDGLATVRMYDSLAAIQHGFARIFFAAGIGRPWRILMATAAVPLGCFSAYGALAWGSYRVLHPVVTFGGWGWLIAAGVHLGLLTACFAAVYAWTGNRRAYALLLPLGAGILLGILAASLRICLTRKVEWRGTRYVQRQELATESA
jgi:chlorobactene glucosyltransferase